MNKTHIKAVFFCIALVMGIVISMQFRSIFHTNKENQASRVNINDYVMQLENEKKKGVELAEKIKKYEKDKEDYLKKFTSLSDDSGLKLNIDDTKVKAGLTDVKGSGIIVKMTDAQYDKNQSVRSLLIHDMDIVNILNELKIAGAQALSINGQRIISTSEQVCTGPTVRINKNRYAVPFEIKAIGDGDELQKQLEKSSSVQVMRQFGIKIEISKSKEVTVPRYNNEIKYLITGLEVYKGE